MATMHKDELISALMDSECGRFEIRRSVDLLISDNDLRARWGRYHLIGNVLRRDATQIAGADFHSKVMAQLTQEQADNHYPVRVTKRWSKPLLGFVMAASVAAVMVLGMQSLLEPVQVRTDLVQPAPSLERPGRLADVRQAHDPGRHVATQLESYMRMNSYLLSHAQQSGGQGVMPFVRMVSYSNSH